MATTKKRGPGRPKGSKNKNTSKKSTSKKTTNKTKRTPKEVPISQVTTMSREEELKEMRRQNRVESRVYDFIWGVVLAALGVFFFCTIVLDITGSVGIRIHNICLGLFGFMANLLPFYFIVIAVMIFARKMQRTSLRTAVCSIVLFIDLCLLNSYRFINEASLKYGFADIGNFYRTGVHGRSGGAIGMELGSLTVKAFGKAGLIIIGIAVLIVCVLLIVNSPLSRALEKRREQKETDKFLGEMDDGTSKKRLLDRDKTYASIDSGTFEPVNSGYLYKPEDVRDMKTMKPTELPKYAFVRSDGGEQINNQEPTYREEPQKSYGLDGESHSSGYGLDGYDLGNYGQSGNGYGLGGNGTKAGNSQAVAAGRTDMTGSDDASSYGSASAMSGLVINGAGEDEPEEQEAVKKAPAKKTRRSKGAAETPDVSDADAAKLEEDLTSGFTNSGSGAETYVLPEPNLLKKPRQQSGMLSKNQLAGKAALLEKTLNDFGVEARVLNVTQGASVTRYEVQPATGVKVNKITALADDIALNMRAKSIRMEAPIPGKAAVGIEIENDKAAPVLIRELIESEEFINAKSKISFVVGKDISGRNIVANLKDMPHLLIAGATGSGKSVCINTIIASILYKAKPSEVKLIMIDPKVVELGNYNGIPHMIVPVVTDPKKASMALARAVKEMNDRYEAFAKIGVKDLESYNNQMMMLDEPQNTKPQVVIIIDELADLMMAAPAQVEEAICRLAQKARAAGMHLIVATQRPSVDIVTGVIKANIPSRIAFSVSSQFDSRTILDMAGAEKLLGKGDMLFSPVGSNKPLRIQGPFITDSETAAIIDYAKSQGKPQYSEELTNAMESGTESKSTDTPTDELTEDAIEFILKSKQASVSMLQRKFRIGYNRAARIIDEIEERGIIGPSDGSRPRQVLITEDDYYGNNQEDIETLIEEDEEYEEEEIEYASVPEEI